MADLAAEHSLTYETHGIPGLLGDKGNVTYTWSCRCGVIGAETSDRDASWVEAHEHMEALGL